jgi:hypothetical protein
MDFIDFTRETIVGFISERRRDNPFYSGPASGVSEKARVNSVAGDDSKRVWNFHEARLTMERRSPREHRSSSHAAAA